MGDKQSREVSFEELELFYTSKTYNLTAIHSFFSYNLSECVDIEKLKKELGNPLAYCSYQVSKSVHSISFLIIIWFFYS